MRAWLLILAGCSAEPELARKLELVDAPSVGNVQEIIAGELGVTLAAREQMLVYVGAPWCEPCVAFHNAAEEGKLDAALGGLRVLVFDADRDTNALITAGYVSNYIPLFAVPRPDGYTSGRQIEGATKDRDAIEQIVPRLKELLGR
jgi:hypothetical protein